MEIVIEIPEDEYNRWQEDGEMDALIVRDAVVNGTPLPKGHGRLIDADYTLKRHCEELCRYKPKCEEDCVIYDLFHLASTIIEADKE